MLDAASRNIHSARSEYEVAVNLPSPLGWGVGTGEKDSSRSRDVFLRYPGHPIVVPKSIRDFTGLIKKTDAYPAAYGGFSDIWSCLLTCTQSHPERVAVKAIRPVVMSEEEHKIKRKIAEQELEIWVRLEHQNILPLYGIVHGFGAYPAFVCPWADNGTLSEYLEKPETPLDMKKRLILLDDIAAGLQYLHACNIAHGDLSGVNILIDGNGRACLSDFGLSTLLERVSDTTVSGISFPGNIRWAAPELFDEYWSMSELSNQRADIYSFGSIMLQIAQTLTGKLPFHEVQRIAQIVIMVSQGNQPPRGLGWDGNAIPDSLWRFAEACWASPSERPSGKDIVSFIQNEISKL